VTKEELDRQKQDLAQRIDYANTQLAAGQKELQDLQSFRAKQSGASPRLDAQIAALEANLEETKAHTAALASQSARI